MRVVLVNASPRRKKSVSYALMERFFPYLKNEEYGILEVNEEMDEKLAEAAVNAGDVIIIFAPVYNGSLPSSLIAFLELLDYKLKKRIRLGAVVHSASIDPASTELSLRLLKYWCEKSGCAWIGGIGISKAEILRRLTIFNNGRGPVKQIIYGPGAFHAYRHRPGILFFHWSS